VEEVVAPHRLLKRLVVGCLAGVIVCLIVIALGFWWSRARQASPPVGISLREYELATKAFERRYRQRPEHADVVSWLAETAVAENDLPRAAVCFDAIPTSHPRYGRSARLQQGQVLLKLKRAPAAEAQLRTFLELERADPQSPPEHVAHALSQLRHLLEVQLRFEERRPVLRELVVRRAADGFETIAFCFPTLLRWNGSQTQEWLAEFLHEDPDDFRLRFAQARYATGNGNLDTARSLINELAADRPDDRAVLAARAAIAYEAADWNELALVLEGVTTADTDPWLLHRLRGHWLNHERRFAEAVEQFLVALRLDPACAECHVGLAEAFGGLSQPERQREAADKARQLARIQNRLGRLDTEPDQLDALFEVAALSEEIGLAAEARTVAEYLLRLSPGHAKAKTLRARLPTDTKPTADDRSVAGVDRREPPARQPLNPETRSAQSPRRDTTPLTSAGEAAPRFTAVARRWKVNFTRHDDITGLHRILESNGGGVAAFDFDLDGWIDLFFTNGCRLPRRVPDPSHSSELFRNRGRSGDGSDVTFARVTLPAGLRQSGYFYGCTVGDVDSDGFDDLFVTAFGRHVLWLNQGDGTFRDATDPWGVAIDAWGSSAAFGDFNRDGHLDLYVDAYAHTTDDPPHLCPNKSSPDGYITCPPTVFAAADDFLLVNDGSGRYRDVTQSAGITGQDGRGLGVVVVDVDRDGWPEVIVANDGTPNFLYLNRTAANRGGRAGSDQPLVPKFDEQAAVLGVAVDREGKAVASMGIACGDTDGDGWPDILITTFYLEASTFFRNLGGVGFVDDSLASGLGPPTRRTLGFGTEFLDCDNDGWLDVFIANGHVDDVSWGPGHEPYRMPPQFFRNDGRGRFSERTAQAGDYFQGKWLGRGVAVADLDNDGDIDLAVSHQLDPSEVLRNDTSAPHRSVIVKLVGREPSNRSAIGARIETEGLDVNVVREVIGGGSYQSSSDRRVHVGLGAKPSLPRLRIVWPSGTTAEFEHVAPGHYVAIEGGRLELLP
jgi:tetratricopeptide (TPR) repeat protein